jgi:small-conductance mechanosensitive channel
MDPLTSACGAPQERGWLCTTVYRVTDSKSAAEVADALAQPVRILLVVVIAWIVARVLRRTVTHAAKRLRDQPRASFFDDEEVESEVFDELAARRRGQRVDTLAGVMRNVVSVLVWAIAVLIILGDLGVDLTPLLASAGVASVVIGFGAQQVVRDYLAGLFMLLEDQFGVGDVIDMGEATGTVEAVSLRVTRVRDIAGVVWWVPNGQVTRVGNESQQWSRALLDVAIAPDTDIGLATDVIQRTADEMWHDAAWKARLLAEPEVWGVEDVGSAGILIRLAANTVPLQQWDVARELRARLKRAFDVEGIRLPVQLQRITYEMGGAVPPPARGSDPADGDDAGDT